MAHEMVAASISCDTRYNRWLCPLSTTTGSITPDMDLNIISGHSPSPALVHDIHVHTLFPTDLAL